VRLRDIHQGLGLPGRRDCGWRSRRLCGRFRLQTEGREIEVNGLVEQDVSGAGGVIAKVPEYVTVVYRLDVFVIAHDPSAAGVDEADIVAVVGAAVVSEVVLTCVLMTHFPICTTTEKSLYSLSGSSVSSLVFGKRSSSGNGTR